MNENVKKFIELANTDAALQAKLTEAAKNYTGEQTQKAVFENIISPIAQEAGFSITLDDLNQSVQELSLDELSQVSGGVTAKRKKTANNKKDPDYNGSGFGGGSCYVIGVGALGAITDEGGVVCLIIGGGWKTNICFEAGFSE